MRTPGQLLGCGAVLLFSKYTSPHKRYTPDLGLRVRVGWGQTIPGWIADKSTVKCQDWTFSQEGVACSCCLSQCLGGLQCKTRSGLDSPGKDADWHMKLLLTLWY